MTAFYNEFYERLQMFDSSGKFDAVLSRHSGGQNKIAAKGAIILRIVNFVVRIQGDSKGNAMLLFMLGKSHSKKAIRPWQYSIFVQTLLNTISSRLGREATSDVMEEWVNLFAFVMQGMLPAAIRDQVVETELSINTSSEFTGGKIANEIRVLEDDRAQRKIVTFSNSSPDPNRCESIDAESKCLDEPPTSNRGDAII
jgi:hemoglobin-like flavoprotein